MVNWEELGLYQVESFDAKGNKNKGFLKDLFVAEISQLLQK